MNLSDLIYAHKGDLTWAELAEKAGGYPGPKRWQQYAIKPLANFPDPPSIKAIAATLGVSEQLVINASAESLGLSVSDEGGMFVTMMRSLRGTEQLSDREVTAFVSLVRASVERAVAQREAEDAAAAAPRPAKPARGAAKRIR